MPAEEWADALGELTRAGHRIDWTYGQVADDPIVSGGHILIEGEGPGCVSDPSTLSDYPTRAPSRDGALAPRSLHVPAGPAPVSGRSADNRPRFAI